MDILCSISVRNFIIKQDPFPWHKERECSVIQSPTQHEGHGAGLVVGRFVLGQETNQVVVAKSSEIEDDDSAAYEEKNVSRLDYMTQAHGVFTTAYTSHSHNARSSHRAGDKVWLDLKDNALPLTDHRVSIINLRTCEIARVPLICICWYPSHIDTRGALWTLGGRIEHFISRGKSKDWSRGIRQVPDGSPTTVDSIYLEAYAKQPVARPLTRHEQNTFFSKLWRDSQDALIPGHTLGNPVTLMSTRAVQQGNSTMKIKEYDGVTGRTKRGPKSKGRKKKPTHKVSTGRPVTSPVFDEPYLPPPTTSVLPLPTSDVDYWSSGSTSDDSDSGDEAAPFPITSSLLDYKPALRLTGGSIFENPEFSKKYAAYASVPYKKVNEDSGPSNVWMGWDGIGLCDDEY